MGLWWYVFEGLEGRSEMGVRFLTSVLFRPRRQEFTFPTGNGRKNGGREGQQDSEITVKNTHNRIGLPFCLPLV